MSDHASKHRHSLPCCQMESIAVQLMHGFPALCRCIEVLLVFSVLSIVSA